MRVFFFVNHFFPSVGGVQWSVRCTAEALQRRGHEVTVITETPADATTDDTEFPFSIIRFHVPRRRPITRLFYWQWMWTQRERFDSADVLHFHDNIPFFAWFLPLRLVIRKPRYVITYHGYEHWPILARHRFSRAISARCCDVRFAVGDYIRTLYHHPIDAVYLGAPVRHLSPATRSPDPVFAYAGRLAPDTEILPLLHALRHATDREDGNGTSPVTVRLAGEGPLRREISALAGDGLRIEFLGVRMDTAALYPHARYVIATGFLGIFEAFASGIPVIVPAFNPLRQLYVRSIPGADQLLTMLRTGEEGVAFFRAALAGGQRVALEEKSKAALEFVSQLSWDDIAGLFLQWYSPAASGTHRAAAQWER